MRRIRDERLDLLESCVECCAQVHRADMHDHLSWHHENRPREDVPGPVPAATPRSQITETSNGASFRCFRCGLVAEGLPVTGAGSYGRGHEEVCDGPPTGAGYRQVLDLKPGDVVDGLGVVVQVVSDVELKGKCRVWIRDGFGDGRGAYLLPSFAYVPIIRERQG